MSPATAVAAAAAKPRPLTSRAFEVAMAPVPVHVTQMRQFTAAFMRLWAVPVPLAEDVLVVVSELVTNAIKHGHGAVGLRVRCYDGELLLEVSDDNPSPAQLRAAADDDVCGRGLFLVALLSRDWGVGDDGRTTWAAFHNQLERPCWAPST
ncbi:ATP-binding protein [Streptomyces mirabilis]|uniref:ATP-binding protein n=2 Tax=Streptomyces TaxID=1883 RepID=UPI000BCEE622|nr:Histidine kinase-like ATPase domain-containing protein [Streptomyces sp. OK228]